MVGIKHRGWVAITLRLVVSFQTPS
ncbi:hypothetical protein EMIT0111MI5_10601 [Burkholderia sp. IT-111MI5]